MFGGGDEIGECVLLLPHAAGIVPGFAKFSAAANVGHSIDHAAIKQAQTVRTEVDWHGNAVAAVTIEQQGRFPVAWRVFSIHDRDWDASEKAGLRKASLPGDWGLVPANSDAAGS